MAKTRNPRKPMNKKHQNKNHQPLQTDQKPPPSWAVMRSLFTCKHLQTKDQQQQQPQSQQVEETNKEVVSSKRCKKMGCSGSSLCSNTRVMHRPESLSPDDSKKWVSSIGASSSSSSSNNGSISRRSIKAPLTENNGGGGGGEVVSSSSSSTTSTTTTTNTTSSSSTSSTRSSVGGSFRGMQLRRFSGCYECRMVVDPSHLVSRDSASLRNTLCSCPQCGEVFIKSEDLELHQSIRHAVSELGPEDSSRNIVEIIFQSSWLKKQAPVCKIERILKVQNSQKTITRFEDYRESIKSKANKLVKKHPRCVADGNELLRFHCTTFVCSIGVNGSSNLCNSIPQCNVCSIIKNGFKIDGGVASVGICTTATSGKAHDKANVTGENEKRAMLVCRVIAGRVKRNQDTVVEEFDSVAGPTGIYSDLDELSVFNSKAILPCFVVIYGGF